jgi:hypothetical protein
MPDPAVVETVVVKPDEIVTAREASERGTESVLRVTAPFSARMRARLHVKQAGDEDDDRQLLLPARDLLEASCPAFPSTDDTADRLREQSDEAYSVKRHREAHETAVAEWRQAVPEHVVDHVSLAGADESVAVDILGK